MTHSPPLAKRKALTKFQFAELFLDQQGKCDVCGSKLVLKRGLVRDEHLHQISTGGGEELSNRALRCLPCAKAKDTVDGRVRAKIRSLNKTTKKSQQPKAKIQSRGFNTPKDYKHKWANRGFGT